jgi:PPM family protein phosphatase
MFDVWSKSDPGDWHRSLGYVNEDRFLIRNELQLVVIADGMKSGREVAAADVALRVVEGAAVKHAGVLLGGDALAIEAIMKEMFLAANREMIQMGALTPSLGEVLSTATGILFNNARVCIAHVGNCRAYRVREQRILQVTADHTLLAEVVRAGVTVEPAHRDFYRLVTRLLGKNMEVDVDVITMDVEANDIFLLGSDGLFNVVTDQEIERIVAANHSEAVPDALIALANARCSEDNITVVVCRP